MGARTDPCVSLRQQEAEGKSSLWGILALGHPTIADAWSQTQPAHRSGQKKQQGKGTQRRVDRRDVAFTSEGDVSLVCDRYVSWWRKMIAYDRNVIEATAVSGF